MLQTFDVCFPGTNFKIEIVLPISNSFLLAKDRRTKDKDTEQQVNDSHATDVSKSSGYMAITIFDVITITISAG